MHTFVFISDIPDYLLQPMQPKNNTSSESSSMTAAESHMRANRDPRFERLRRLLSLHTSGVMLVMHLENKPFALALYASEQEALAACKTTIIPERTSHWQKINGNTAQTDIIDVNNPTINKQEPLKLRIVQKEMPRPIEAVYTPTITIEGSVVKKDDLVLTRGLELVYRGKAVARWCENTKAERDCPFGWGCHKIHLKQFQHTIRKRPRAHNNSSIKDNEADNYYNYNEEEESNTETKQALDRLLRSYVECQEKLVQADTLQLSPRVIVPISVDEAEHLFLHCNTEAECDSNVHHANSLAHTLIKRVQLECSKVDSFTGPYFIRLSCPSGSPWDWSLYDDDDDDVKNNELPEEHIEKESGVNEKKITIKRHVSGLKQLRAFCPYPAHGTQTLLERDLYLQQLFYYMNQLNKFDTIEEAFHALMCSQRVKEGLRTYFHNIHKTDTRKKKVDMTNIPLPLGPETSATKEKQKEKIQERHLNEASQQKHQQLEEEEEQLYLCVVPWLYLPTVGTEVSVFMQRNGNVLCGVVQRYAQLRLMLPFTRLLKMYNSRNSKMLTEKSSKHDNNETEIDKKEEEVSTLMQIGKDSIIDKEITSELHKFVLLSNNNTANDEDIIDDENINYNNNNNEIIESEGNVSSVLTREIKSVSKAFMRAIEELRRYIASRDVESILYQHNNGENYELEQSNSNQTNASSSSSLSITNTSWCAHLALVLPTQGVFAENRDNKKNMKEEENNYDKKSRYMDNTHADSLRVAVLSFAPFHDALDALALYNVIDSNGNAVDKTNVNNYMSAKGMDVVWNTHKHQYISLLDRGVLEKLKVK